MSSQISGRKFPEMLNFLKIHNPRRIVAYSILVSEMLGLCVCLDESSRVYLQPIRGIEGSDYINASFIDVSESTISFQSALIAQIVI